MFRHDKKLVKINPQNYEISTLTAMNLLKAASLLFQQGIPTIKMGIVKENDGCN